MKLFKNLLQLSAILLAADVFALQPQPTEKAAKGGDKHQSSERKTDKGHKSNQQLQVSQDSMGNLTVSITSAGITIQHAKELATQYQVRGGRQLPPGIRKQLAKGKPLPPGIAKKVTQPEFLAALPQHSGHEWQICGTDLVLVAVGTALIVDILSDVF